MIKNKNQFRHQFLTTIFILFFIGLLAGCSNEHNQVNVTTKSFNLFPGGGINNRNEVEVTLVIKNTSSNPFRYDSIVCDYLVNGKSVGASQTSFMKLSTIEPGSSKEESIQSMNCGFGDFIGNEFKKKIEISFLKGESKVSGTLAIDVPHSFGY